MSTLVRCSMQQKDPQFFQLIDDLELSFTQFKILVGLWEQHSELPLKAICTHLHLSLPAVSRAVDGLVQRDLVERDEDSSDRRSKRVRATAKARDLLERVVEVRAAAIVDLAASITPEQRDVLSAALDPVIAQIDALNRVPIETSQSPQDPD
jgi:DNA-binding MarR family transcriptional regulator